MASSRALHKIGCMGCTEYMTIDAFWKHMPCPPSLLGTPTSFEDFLSRYPVMANCTRCQKTFNGVLAYETHLEECKRLDKQTKLFKKFKLRECSVPLQRVADHQSREKVEQRLHCFNCGKKFRSKKHVERHSISCPSRNAKLQGRTCLSCNVCFTRSTTLGKHLKIKHNVKKLRCDLCAQWFVNEVQLNDHFVFFKDTVGCVMKRIKTIESVRELSEKLNAQKPRN